jgi:tetratricopeptide (TPR) repeat protein
LTASSAPPRIRPADTGEVIPAAATVSPQEAAFHVGCTSYAQGDFAAAYQTFTPLIDSPHHDDARFTAGICAAYLDAHDEAISFLVDLMEQGQEPLPGSEGSLVTKYLPTATVHIPITQSSAATLPLNMLAALFLLSELLQSQGNLEDATHIMEEVFRQEPNLRLAQLALSDLYLQAGRYEDLFNLFSHHTPELKATDNITLEVLYNWAVALTAKGLYDAADLVYKRALSRRKDIDPYLRRIVRYGRADLYLRQGKPAMARKTFEQIFAEDPGFLDVSERISALKA